MKSVTYRTMSIVLKCAEDYCNPLEITSQRMALQMVFIISMLQMHLFWIWLSNRDRFFSENQSQILKQLLCGLLLHDQLNSLSACDSHPIWLQLDFSTNIPFFSKLKIVNFEAHISRVLMNWWGSLLVTGSLLPTPIPLNTFYSLPLPNDCHYWGGLLKGVCKLLIWGKFALRTTLQIGI